MQQYYMEITLHVLHKLKKIILKMIEPNTSYLVFFHTHELQESNKILIVQVII